MAEHEEKAAAVLREVRKASADIDRLPVPAMVKGPALHAANLMQHMGALLVEQGRALDRLEGAASNHG